jgi:hypothetical protein
MDVVNFFFVLLFFEVYIGIIDIGSVFIVLFINHECIRFF